MLSRRRVYTPGSGTQSWKDEKVPGLMLELSDLPESRVAFGGWGELFTPAKILALKLYQRWVADQPNRVRSLQLRNSAGSRNLITQELS